MSLIAWYPLDGNYQDYSTNNFHGQVLNTKWNNDGKIGKCLEMNNSEFFYHHDKSYFDKCFSMSLWFKILKQSNEYQTLIKIYNGAAVIDISKENKFRFFIYDTNNQTKVLTSKNVPINEWVHITGTYNGKELVLYMNGEQVSKMSCSDTPRFLDNKNKYIAVGVRENDFPTRNYLNGLVNDARFYNHCLSSKEIKEIYNTKILHYNFNDPLEEPTINLIKTISHGISVSLNKYETFWRTSFVETKEFVNKSHNFGIHIFTDKCANGKTFSGYAKVKVSKKMTLGVLLQKNGGDWQTSETVYYKMLPNEWNDVYCSGSFNKSDDATIHMRIFPEDRSEFETPNSFFDTKNMIIEEKNHSTFYTNEKRDYLIADSSGYKHHGVIKEDTSPKWTNETILGNGAFEFNGIDNFITTNSNTECKVTDAITVSVWAYKNKWDDNKDERLVSCTEDGGWNFEKNIDKSPGIIRFSIKINNVYNLASIYLKDINPGWHLFTGVYDKSSVKFYLDSTLKASTKIEKNNLPIQYNSSNAIFIGAEAEKSIDKPYQKWAYFQGKIADVQIYATALQEDDIKNLYNSKASISNNGKLFVNYINEIPNNNVCCKDIIVNAQGYPNISYVKIDNNTYKGLRSWGILEINEKLEYVKNKNFDVFVNNNNEVNNFLSYLKDIPDDHFIVIFTTDQPTQNNENIIKELSKYSSSIKSYNFNGRCAYYLVFRKKDNNVIAENFVPYIGEGKTFTGENNITLKVNKNAINKMGQINTDEIDEVSIFDMPIKYEHEALWARIYYHNSKGGTMFFSDSDWKKIKEENKESYLYYLENLRNENNEFELLLQTNETKLYNRWKQSNDFTKPEKREGYIPIHIDFPGRDEAIFGGFRLTNSNATFIDGSLGTNWWFAICPKRKNGEGTPTFPFTDTKGITELWIRIDNIKKDFKVCKNYKILANEFIEI